MNTDNPWEKHQTPIQRFLRAASQLLAQLVVAWLLFSLFSIIFLIDPETWGNNESLVALYEIVKLIVLTVSVFLVVRIADDYEITALGLKRDRNALRDFGAGIGITFIALAVTFVLLLAFDWIRIDGFAWQARTASVVLWNILGTFLIFVFVGWSEELLSRGFHLQTIQRGLNRFWGILLSSVIFASLHLGNPDMTWAGILFIFFAGLVFAYAYLKTGQLWLSIGLHAGWDFFVVVVFFATPIDGLRLFNLMDVSVSATAPPIISYVVDLLALAICLRLTQSYVRARKRRTEAGKVV